jgi:hypothetical protein
MDDEPGRAAGVPGDGDHRPGGEAAKLIAYDC